MQALDRSHKGNLHVFKYLQVKLAAAIALMGNINPL